MGIAKALLVLSLAAVAAEPIDTTWRAEWRPGALLTSEKQLGSMNHAVLAFQAGLLDAYHREDMATLQELADWTHEYMDVSRNHLGLMESPHSRIYLEWVLVPWLSAWSVFTDLGWSETADEIHDWVRATLSYLALVAVDEPAMIGRWSYTHDREPWQGFGVAVPGARSWSFEIHDGLPMFHHLDRWDPDWILAYLLGAPVTLPASSWSAAMVKSLQRIHDPRLLLSPAERFQLRRVILRGKVPRAVLMEYLEEFRPGDTFSYLRFERGTVGVMHTARSMRLSTSALQAAKLETGTGDLEVLALDNGRRNTVDDSDNVSRPTTTISSDYTRVTARAPGRATRSMDISDLGPLIYHVEASREGVRMVRSRRRVR